MRTQRGIALLTVLLVVSLMALLLADMTFRYRSYFDQTLSRTRLDQARWYADSAEQLAAEMLRQAFEDEDVVHLGQGWARKGLVFPVEDGTIQGELRDRQGCFNINALKVPDNNGALPKVLRAFLRLLEERGIEPFQARQIALATRDWLYSDDNPESYGDSYYQSLPMPYLAGKTMMRDTSTWRSVSGVTPAVARKVMPYLCALPVSDLAVNVNTIPADQPELLAALYLGDLPVSQARDLLKERPRDGWETVGEFLGQALLANFSSTTAKAWLTTTSDFFELRARATYLGTVSGITSLFRRSDDSIEIISRKYGI